MMQYVLKNGIILDGTENMKPVTGHMIRVENDKIAEILPENSPVSGCEVIDLKGAYVLPGLINLHVHLATSGKPPRANKKPTNYKRLFQILSRSRLVKFVLKRMLRGYARTELMSGVTTIRTVGGILDMDARIRDEINAGKIQGPRILAGNTGVSVPGGHFAGSIATAVSSPEDEYDFIEVEDFLRSIKGPEWEAPIVKGSVSYKDFVKALIGGVATSNAGFKKELGLNRNSEEKAADKVMKQMKKFGINIQTLSDYLSRYSTIAKDILEGKNVSFKDN